MAEVVVRLRWHEGIKARKEFITGIECVNAPPAPAFLALCLESLSEVEHAQVEGVIPTVFTIQQSAFRCASHLTTVDLRHSAITVIGAYSFGNCGSLRTVALPRHLAIIEEGAFLKCVSLTDIVLPHTLEELGNSVFEKCRALTRITIPPRIKVIGSCTFYCCTALASVVLPEGLTHILGAAFYECPSLQHMNLPSTLRVAPYDPHFGERKGTWIFFPIREDDGFR